MISYTSFVFFIAFFGVVYILYSVVPVKAKWCVLLAGSCFFYFVSAKKHVIPLIVTTLAVWMMGIVIQSLNDRFKAKKKSLSKDERKKLKQKNKNYKLLALFAGVAVSFALLLICKYSNFFIATSNALFSSSFKEVDIIQPLGISFYTLQAVSYLTDIYRGKYDACKNPFRVLLYLSFLLTVVEGPVARYDQIGTQINTCKKFSTADLVYGAQRIVWGLFKKIVIADRAAVFVNAVFSENDNFGGAVVLFAILFYTLQLYCEFSGVMDVVSGMGEMMGINLPSNFNQPFFAKTINEFWQRWHITLGGWLRDYIFYPVSLSKPFRNFMKFSSKRFNAYYANLVPTAVALFFVWFGNGFWHGSGWKYICYGLYYYVLMMLALFFEPLFAKICNGLKINRTSKPYRIFQIARTFVIVNIGMLIFRADTINQAFSMIKSVFTGFDLSVLMPGHKNGIGLALADYLVIVLSVIILFVVGLVKEKGVDIRKEVSSLPFALKFVIYMASIFAVIIFGAYGEGYGVVDLIYANF